MTSRLFFDSRSVLPCRADATTPFFLVGWADRTEVVENAERCAVESEMDDEASMDERERERHREQIDCDIAAGVDATKCY